MNGIRERWKTRKLEDASEKLQTAAYMNDMRPIWGLQSKLRMGRAENIAIKKKDVAECHGGRNNTAMGRAVGGLLQRG